MTQKTLSVIIPSYNMEKYLERCLSSLIVDDVELLQSLDVIVVNDGSKDRTSEIAHVYESKYPGVFRVIDKLNGNYGSCINAALPLIQGSFVRILDADDCFSTGNFSGYLSYLQCLKGVDMVLSDTEDVSDKIKEVDSVNRYNFPPRETMRIEDVLGKCSYLMMNTIAYRSAIFKDLNYSQTEGISYTDTQWSILPLVHVQGVSYYPEVIYRYTVSRDGQTMEAATTAKNFWMFARCALDVAGQYMVVRDHLSGRHLELMDRRVVRFAALPYSRPYKKSGGVKYNIDLEDYDRRLHDVSLWVYNRVAEVQVKGLYSCKCVHEWRRKSIGGRIRLVLFAITRDFCQFVRGMAQVFKRETCAK